MDNKDMLSSASRGDWDALENLRRKYPDVSYTHMLGIAISYCCPDAVKQFLKHPYLNFEKGAGAVYVSMLNMHVKRDNPDDYEKCIRMVIVDPRFKMARPCMDGMSLFACTLHRQVFKLSLLLIALRGRDLNPHEVVSSDEDCFVYVDPQKQPLMTLRDIILHGNSWDTSDYSSTAEMLPYLDHLAKNPERAIYLAGQKLGLPLHSAADLYVIVTCLCDGYLEHDAEYLQYKDDPQAVMRLYPKWDSPPPGCCVEECLKIHTRFFAIVQRLPMELQMTVCLLVYDTEGAELIPSALVTAALDSELQSLKACHTQETK